MKKIICTLLVAWCSIAATHAQSKIGYVRSQALLDTMPSRKAYMASIKKEEADGLKELQDMSSAIETVYNKYQKDAGAMSEAVKQYEENRIRRMQQNMEDRQKQIDESLQAKTNQMNNIILERVKKAIAIVAQAQQFNYILDESTTLYSAGGIDVTKDVMEALLKLEKAN